MTDLWTLVGSVTFLAIFLFALAWAAARRIDNYSVVDALWALSFGMFALVILLFGAGDPTRKLLFGGMYLIWSLRLGIFLTVRIFSHLDEEDRRYVQLRQEYGAHVGSRFFLFFMYQAISVVILLAPLFLVSTNGFPRMATLEWAGAVIWLVGLVGEAIADSQMSRFRADPANRGQVCESGLWYYSRHPNYFFESVIWLGYGVFALGTPYGWITLFAPMIIWFLLLRVTGVPMAEATSLRTRGDAYREYQKTTSIFIPLPKRRPGV